VKVAVEVPAKVKGVVVVLAKLVVKVEVVKSRDRCRAPVVVVVESQMEVVMVVNKVVNKVRIPSPLIVMVTLKLDVGT
jgi:hypothetical protein